MVILGFVYDNVIVAASGDTETAARLELAKLVGAGSASFVDKAMKSLGRSTDAPFQSGSSQSGGSQPHGDQRPQDPDAQDVGGHKGAEGSQEQPRAKDDDVRSPVGHNCSICRVGISEALAQFSQRKHGDKRCETCGGFS